MSRHLTCCRPLLPPHGGSRYANVLQRRKELRNITAFKIKQKHNIQIIGSLHTILQFYVFMAELVFNLLTLSGIAVEPIILCT